MKEYFENAVKYAAQYVDKVDICYVVNKMWACNCPAYMVNDLIFTITDYMDEYAEGNDLPEDFWADEFDEDDIIYGVFDILK